MGSDLMLPRPLEQALHLLFDVLDEDKTGVISLRTIQQQPDLPLPVSGLLDALAKVAQPGGQLTLDRFLAGVKIALIRTANSPKQQHQTVPTTTKGHENIRSESDGSRKADMVAPDTYARQTGYRRDIGRNDHMLGPGYRETRPLVDQGSTAQYGYRSGSDSDQQGTKSTVGNRPFKSLPGTDPQLLGSDQERDGRQARFPGYRSTGANDRLGSGDYESSTAASKYARTRGEGQISADQWRAREMADSQGTAGGGSQQGPGRSYGKRQPGGSREQRRHTLSSGVDYAMIKGMKLLEQEKDGLLQGLAVLEQAQGWFQAQLRGVGERQRSLGQQGAPGKQDHSNEAAQERLNFRASRISEVCDRLQVLMDSSHRRFPSHMNLAMHQHPQKQEHMDRNIVSLLRSQNHMLSQEVGEKSEKIAQLENEKAIIIRQMFEALAHNRNNTYDDTTFL